VNTPSGGTSNDAIVKSSDSVRQPVEVLGPDALVFVIVPYDRGYVWEIRNDGVASVQELRIKVVSRQSFNAKWSAFREAVQINVQWLRRNISSEEPTKGAILVEVRNDRLELSEKVGLEPLLWPKADLSMDQRWKLAIEIRGASQVWVFELEILRRVGINGPTVRAWSKKVDSETSAGVDPTRSVDEAARTSTIRLAGHDVESGAQVDPPQAAPAARVESNAEPEVAWPDQGIDFTTEAGRIAAVTEYTGHFDCSEASLAREAWVDPSDLSRWKKGTLSRDSEKRTRIEAVIVTGTNPIPAPRAPRE
jgi:hypothetical protein